MPGRFNFPSVFRLPRGTQPKDVSPDAKIQGVDNAWFSPLQPIPPFAPAGIKPRQWGYDLGQNIEFEPRTGRMAAPALRTLANAWPLLRLVIETAKDQILRVDWDISLRRIPGESSRDHQKRVMADSRLAQLKDFMACPDGVHPFRSWLRMLLEDLFVIDAMAVYLERDVAGKIALLRQLDGATITRLIDARGVTPAPPQPAYQQVLYGMPAVNMTSEDLSYGIYYEHPDSLYGYSPVEQLLLTINQGLRRDILRMNFYSAGNMPEMLVMVQDAPMDKIERYQQYINSMLAGNLEKRNQAIFLPSAGNGKDTVIMPKQNVLADEYDDFLVRLVCYAFSVSPNALQKPMNRASAEAVSDTSAEEGLLPKLQWLEDQVNLVIQQRMGLTQYEFRWQTTRDTDVLKQAQADKIYVDSGVKTPNELRQNLGLDPVATPEADMLGIVTAAGFVPLTMPVQPNAQPNSQPKPDGDDDGLVPKKPAKKAFDVTGFGISDAGDPEALLEDALAQKLATVFRGTLHRITSAMGLAKADDKKLTHEQKAALLQSILDEVDVTWQMLPDITEPSLAMAALQSASNGAAQVGSFVGFRQIQDQARKWAKNRAAEMVGKKWVDGDLVDNPDARWAISDTTRNDLREIFADKANLGPTDFLQAIKKAGSFSDDRAQLIARTELKRIGQHSQLEAWKHSGKVAKVRWNLSMMGVHCPVCITNAASEPVELGKQFPSGDEAPPNHPRCGCYLTITEFKKTVGPFAGHKHSPDTKARIAASVKARRSKKE